ncbi:DUF72 domain-containing protein [Ferruginibacter sp. HRS2-29]|uniref:DUF72 domain-containing protein n=1 Tax=Ferruginibacter sp. HRS2-29 TaxID=2487334 RepID=UPI0020CCD9F1|nr:DUF72 domain-containing protein [Ferruginibacter sp. HRS2-29]MCP9749949.1 DUF72 domain-containing protein [Ferruginibacter sp. HRS2-29]
MEFGRVPEAELDMVDFSLPKDPAFNKTVFSGEPAKKPKVYLGCAKWGRKEWVGKIYPPGTKEKDFLNEYVHHYNSIELNATHYKIYDADAIKKWADKAGKQDFLFCPKMYKGVTHFGNLKGKEFITTEFLKGLLAFNKHLGPIFVQVSESFSPNRKEELFDYLKTLPTDLQFFVEVRHPGFFEKKEMEELCATLKKLKMGIVITDTAGRRDCAHMYLTVPKAFIRYVGNSLHESDYKRMDLWVKRIKHWLDNGLKELYFFMHMHNEATSPELTVDIVDKLNKACGLKLTKPIFVMGQKGLFD